MTLDLEGPVIFKDFFQVQIAAHLKRLPIPFFTEWQLVFTVAVFQFPTSTL